MLKQYQLKNYRFRLIIYVIVITVIGIFVIGSAEESVQMKQVMGLILSLVIMGIASVIDYSFILKFSWFIYIVTVGILMFIKIYGYVAGGAARWIVIAGFRFQPSELSKVLLILFFAWFLGNYQEKLNTFKIIMAAIVLALIPIFLILSQPDMSTSIVVFLIIITLLFLAGLSYRIIGTAIAVAIPTGIIFITLILQPGQKILLDYQVTRIMSFLQPEKYADNRYQQENSIMAIGSGQLWGKGLNNESVSSVKNGNFIPEPQTDFIFSIVGEELGFVGCAIIILLLLLIVLECIMIGRKAKDLYGRLICGGVAAWIGFQAFINICVVTGMMPNTGLTLPFVSYGLSSLVSLFLGIGFVLNVGLQPKKYGTGDVII